MSAASSLRAVPDPFTPAEIAHYYKVRAPQVKQAGSEWRGPCTLHHGTRDSFAVDPKTGEWYCHSDCSRGGSMIGFEMELSGKSFAEAAAEVRAVCGRTERRPKGPIVASYDYVDEDGKLLFQCLRYEPKPSVSGARTGAADGSQTSREYAACYSGCRKSGKRKRFWSPKVKRMSSAW